MTVFEIICVNVTCHVKFLRGYMISATVIEKFVSFQNEPPRRFQFLGAFSGSQNNEDIQRLSMPII